MTGIVRWFLADRRRYLAFVAGLLAAAVAATVALTVDSGRPAERGTPQPDPVQVTHTEGATPATPPKPAPATTEPPAVTPVRSTRPATPTPTATSPRAEAPVDLLKRRDPVPDGVPEQVTLFLGGGGTDCTEEPPTLPYIGGAAETTASPAEFVLCFYGFDLEPLTVTVTPPSGSPITTALPSGDVYIFRALPGDPLGRYLVTAIQDKLEASLEFTLARASAPRLWLDARRSERRPAGTDFDVYLGGFPENRPARIHLYETHEGRYRTSFTVAVDKFGEAHAIIDTKSDDPPGCYAIISDLTHRPGDAAESVFCIK